MALSDIVDFIAAHRGLRFALMAHQRPDGDALGSCLGLAYLLTAAGCPSRVITTGPISDKLSFLISESLVVTTDPSWHTAFDCVGILDCGDLDRLDESSRPAVSALPAFTIDHHLSSSGLGQAVWIDPEASSTGEMVVRLAETLDWPVGPAAAEALWTSIITDTGRFSFENTSPAALHAARICLEAGAKPAEIARRVYQSVSPAERRLQTLVLERMELMEDGRLAVSWLSTEDLEACGSGVEGVQDLIRLLRETAGVEIAVFFYQIPTVPETVKVSMRTVAPYSALDVVCRFDGGGHQRAAGCSIALPLTEARQQVLQAVREAYFS